MLNKKQIYQLKSYSQNKKIRKNKTRVLAEDTNWNVYIGFN